MNRTNNSFFVIRIECKKRIQYFVDYKKINIQMSLYVQQKLINCMQVTKQNQQITLSTFIKISCLLCLTNLLIVSRLHMFDQSTVTAQHFYDTDLKLVVGNPNPTFYTPKLSSATGMYSLFTDIQLQLPYLLPLVLQLSALLIVISKGTINRIYTNLLGCVFANMLCFIFLWVWPSSFFVYRITFIVQAFLSFPLLITSSFGMTKIIPYQIATMKGYFACLSFFIPYLGLPLGYWMFDGEPFKDSPTDVLKNSFNRLVTLGFVSGLLTFFTLFENRVAFNNSLDAKIINAIQTAQHRPQIEHTDIDPNHVKQKLSNSDYRMKQAKVFSDIHIKNGHKIDQSQSALRRQKLSEMIMSWGAILAVGSQLTQLKKALLQSLNQRKQYPHIQTLLKKSNSVEQFKVVVFTIVVSMVLITLIRHKKLKTLQVAIISTIIGYSAIIILFIAANKILTLNIWLINTCIIVSRIFMQVFLIPTIMYIEEEGVPAIEGISILFLISWATELILRLLLPALDKQMKLFILAFIAVVGCYMVQKTGKQDQQQLKGHSYNQIRQSQLQAQHQHQHQNQHQDQHQHQQNEHSPKNLSKQIKSKLQSSINNQTNTSIHQQQQQFKLQNIKTIQK